MTIAEKLETISGLWAQEAQEAIADIAAARNTALHNVTTALGIIDGNLNSLAATTNARLNLLKEATERYELELEEVAALLRNDIRIEVYETTTEEDRAEYRWRAVHNSNGENMGDGEGYSRAEDRDHAVSVLFPGLEVTEVTE